MIVVDVETGGIEPELNPLLSIGAVDYSNQERKFYGECRPYPGQIMTGEAVKINGITVLESEEFPALERTLNDFQVWLGEDKQILAGQNPSFDNGFLSHNFKTVGHKSPFGYRTIDLHSIAFACFGESLTTNQIYEKLNMDREPDPHNALTGAEMETKAFNKLFEYTMV